MLAGAADTRFEVLERVGAGGMGTVYRARDRRSGKVLALKVLNAPSTDALMRFAREAEALAAIDHPGIVRYVAHGIGEGRAYLGMEWLEGEDLAARLHRGPLSFDESLTAGRRAAEALAAAHAKGIVHRDVKPSNLFLVNGDVARLKVVDFGLARIEGLPRLTESGVALGTPGYLAPEQALGQPTDASADVFALGCVMFECVTGQRAFQGEHLVDVLAAVLLADVPSLSELSPLAPAPLSDLVARMLAKERRARPPDCGQVAVELGRIRNLTGEVTDAVPTRRPHFFSHEQMFLCIALVRGAAAGNDASSTADGLGSGDRERRAGVAVPPSHRAAVVAAGRANGADVYDVVDGSILLVFDDRSMPVIDAVSRAARLGLDVQGIAPSLRVAIALGRGTADGIDVAGAVRRAESLLPSEARVALDAPTASLLSSSGLDVVAEPGGAHRLLGKRDRVPGPRTVLGKESACVGRDRELSELEGFLDEASREGVARTVLVVGEAGVGKSRLRHELSLRLPSRSVAGELWLGRAEPLEAGSPFVLVASAIANACGVSRAAPPAVVRAAIEGLVRRLAPEPQGERVAAFLGEILGCPFEDSYCTELRAARIDARVMADQMRRAFEELVSAVVSKGPLTLILEDAHWGDSPSLSFVRGAVSRLDSSPLLVLAFARPEAAGPFSKHWPASELHVLPLAPLPPARARTLVRALLDAPDEVVERVVAKGAGNPFALEELVRRAAQSPDAAQDEVPDTVLALAEARLRKLGAADRRVLRAASVLGLSFRPDDLRALLGSAPDLSERLSALVAGEALVLASEGAVFDERRYAFRHAIVRDAAYAMLTAEDRVRAHGRAAAWLEGQGTAHPIVLAEHWLQAGQHRPAARNFAAAAVRSLDGDDLDGVVATCERGLALEPEPGLRGELLRLQAEASRWSGRFADASRLAKSALPWLRRGSASWWAAAADAAAATGVQGGGAFDVVAEMMEAGEDDGAAVAVSALVRTGCMLLHAGVSDWGDGLLERAFAFGVERQASDATIRAWLAIARFNQAHEAGELEAALSAAEVASSAFTSAGNRRSAAMARASVGHALLRLGQLDRAREVSERVVADAEAMALSNLGATAELNLAVALSWLGRAAEAEPRARAALASLAAHGNRRLEGAASTALAEILLARSELSEARELATRGAHLFEDAAPSLPWALGVLAAVELASGRATEALALARRAKAALDEVVSEEEGDALVRVVLAEALAAAGDEVEARRALADAHARLVVLRDRIRSPLLRRTFTHAVPTQARAFALAERWLGAPCDESP